MSTTDKNAGVRAIAQAVYDRYHTHYGRDLNGVCPLIADEILATIRAGQTDGSEEASGMRGEAVAGFLTWYGGSCRRAHWWVVVDDEVIDPMGDAFLATEEAVGRVEEYRAPKVPGFALDRAVRWAV